MMDSRRKMFNTARCLLLLIASVLLIAGCAGDKPPAGSETGQPPGIVGGGQSENKAGTVTVTLYFATRDAQALVAEKREVPKSDHPALTAVEELINGPKNPELVKVVPGTTKVKDITVKDHVAYVDFSAAFVKDHWGGSAGEILTVSAITNTLTEFPDIKQVQFMAEGKNLETLKGHLDLSEPMARNEAIIKK